MRFLGALSLLLLAVLVTSGPLLAAGLSGPVSLAGLKQLHGSAARGLSAALLVHLALAIHLRRLRWRQRSVQDPSYLPRFRAGWGPAAALTTVLGLLLVLP